MRSRFLIAYRRRLFRVTTDTGFDGSFALMGLVTFDAIGVTVVLLSRMTIDAIAGGFGLGMALMASEAVRVSRVGPGRDRFLFLLVAICTVSASYPEYMRLVAARTIFVVTRKDVGTTDWHLSLVALRA